MSKIDNAVKASVVVTAIENNLNAMAEQFGWAYRDERYRRAETRLTAARERFNTAFAEAAAEIAAERKCEAIQAEASLSRILTGTSHRQYLRGLAAAERRLRRIIES